MNKIMQAAIIFGAGAAIAAGPLAASAGASTDRFEQRVQEEMPFVVSQYGMPKIHGMGLQICTWEGQGMTDTSDIVDSTVAAMPMSRSAAIQLKVLAEVHLGC